MPFCFTNKTVPTLGTSTLIYSYIVRQINQCKYTGENAACRMLMKLTQAVNFINVKHARISYERHFGSFFLVTCTLLKRRSFEKFNVDEIDGWSIVGHELKSNFGLNVGTKK